MNKSIYIIALGVILLFSSCKKVFDYSPYVIDFDEENSNVNNKNVAKILSQQNTDHVIRIAFTADSHRSSDELNDFVNAVNRLNTSSEIDFVVHVGDFADFGLPKQYLWANSYLIKLDIPYIVVIGNHDLVANGGDAYQQMFGQYNFSFIYDSVKFVWINTNSLEFEFNGKVPDVEWLDKELKTTSDFSKAVVLFHVAPIHGEFDPKLVGRFTETLAKYDNVLFVVHGHSHDFSITTPYADSIPYVNVYSVEYRKYNVITINKDQFKVDTYEL